MLSKKAIYSSGLMISVSVLVLSACSKFELGDYLETWEDVPVEISFSCKKDEEGTAGIESSQTPVDFQPLGEGLPNPLSGDFAARQLRAVLEATSLSTMKMSGFESDDDSDELTANFGRLELEVESIGIGEIEDFKDGLAHLMHEGLANVA